MARKFKYYHRAVRPDEEFNLVDTENGTYFRLFTELEILSADPIADVRFIKLFFVYLQDLQRFLMKKKRAFQRIQFMVDLIWPR